MFAGPNGSGKSVLKYYLPEPLLGVYLNPDEIEQGVKERGYMDLQGFGIQTMAAEVLPLMVESEFLIQHGLEEAARSLSFANGRL